jgi:hypothetical protein
VHAIFLDWKLWVRNLSPIMMAADYFCHCCAPIYEGAGVVAENGADPSVMQLWKTVPAAMSGRLKSDPSVAGILQALAGAGDEEGDGRPIQRSAP